MTERLHDAPWYARLASKEGLASTLVIVMTWFILSNLSTGLRALADGDAKIVENQGRIIENQARIISLLTEHMTSTDRMNRLLTCLEVTKTDADRTQCFATR